MEEDNVQRRLPRLTEKGKAYQTEIKKAECKSVERRLRTQMITLESLSCSMNNVRIVKEELERLETLRLEFERTFFGWMSCIESEDDKVLKQHWFQTRNEELANFIGGIKDFIELAVDRTVNEEELQDRLERTPLHRSGTPDRIAEERMEREIGNLEVHRRSLESTPVRPRTLLKFEPIPVSEDRGFLLPGFAELDLDKDEKEIRRVASKRSRYVEKKPSSASPKKGINVNKVELDSEPFLQFLNRQNQLTEILAKQQQQSLLPALHLSKFSNDPLDYNTFIRSFESQIESRAPSSEVCLRYLEQYLEGEAKDLIKGCLHKRADLGYVEAKRLLSDRYGDPYKISNAYIKKIKEWPTLKPGDDVALERLSIFLTQCVSAMESLLYLSILDHPQNLQNLVKKLPYGLQDRWRRQVMKIRESKRDIPGFKSFADFVECEAKIATDPIFSREALEKVGQDKVKFSKTSFQSRPRIAQNRPFTSHVITGVHSSTSNEQNQRKEVCFLCGGAHDLDECKDYLKKTLTERRTFLFEKGLCFGCYKTGHRSRGCTQKRQCKVCLRCHPTGLHDYNFRQSSSMKEENKNSGQRESQTSNSRIVAAEFEQKKGIQNKKAGNLSNQYTDIKSMPIVPVKLRAKNQAEITTYAMLDNCSTGTFMTYETLKKLNVEGTSTKIMIRTINGSKLQDTKVVTGLVVSDVNGDNCIELPKTYTRDEIPASEEEIPRPEFARKWKHLKIIAEKMPSFIQGLKVGLLIGTNCPKAIEPRDFVVSKDGGPYAMSTFAGWTVIGPLYTSSNRYLMTHGCYNNRIVAQEVYSNKPMEHHFKVQDSVKEIVTPETLNKLLDLEFKESALGTHHKFSIEDNLFLKKIDQGLTFIDGHYEMPLPFRDNDVHMPYNKDQVLQKAKWLKKKLLSSDKLCKDYSKFMKDIIDKDYARRVPQHHSTPPPGKIWYIPHHGVYHPQKPDKIRVVFNCSGKFNGISLNDKLLQGPDLTNTLVGVLTRFLQKPVAFMGDIDSMFHQVRVTEEHRNFLRFLWWTDGDLSKDPEDYQMNVHLFGAISSPSCANYAVKRTADDFEEEVGVGTANVLRRNFYVDDCLRSEDSEEDAIECIHSVISACAKGGFTLSKIVSNKRRVLETIPVEKRCKTIRNIDLNREDLPVERALGVQWCIETDKLGFRITLKDKPCTRRGILSTISSVYDPIGIAAPVILQGKRILQELCKEKTDWDDDIPDEFRYRWEKLRKDLPSLEKFTMSRCLKPEHFGQVSKAQIHSFSDACFTGYGEASYLRQINDRGVIHCSFLMGKARLSPLKAVTIPRLELNAAVLSAKIGNKLADEIDYDLQESVYWTDSTAVLRYVNNDQNRYHVFVANRIQTIRDRTDPSQWKYVSGKDNPADDASRGLEINRFIEQQRWLKGPEFLWRPESEWPACPFDVEGATTDDPEVKITTTATIVEQIIADILERFKYFSQWYKLKKAIARILKLQSRFQKSKAAENSFTNPVSSIALIVTAKDLQRAEIAILKIVQEDAFQGELTALRSLNQKSDNTNQSERTLFQKKKAEIKKTSSLYRLDPFLDADGLMRVGGRLSKSPDLDYDQKHPIILPKKGHITDLIIRHAHQKVAHSGRGTTLNELRNRYWIINANSMVRWFISRCVTCRRLRATVGEQKMADLPKDRVTPAPPFTFCAVDYFGPCLIKEKRKEVKRYGVLFTCLASRAIHLESANSLETDAFLNALRRFIARRGPVKLMRSDQGTNLVGAVRELKECLKEMDQERIREYLLRNTEADWVMEWKFNPPSASHMGGSWERQIRTVRTILVALIRENGHVLNDESFRTLLTEVESIVNSRPLTPPTSDPANLGNPLTPNHLLKMKSKIALPPPGEFQREDLYLRKQWRRVQYLAELFWTRWKKEYLNQLQERKKWIRPKRNFLIGDIVLVADERTPRNLWTLAQVKEVRQDDKGLVRSVKIRTVNSILERPIHKLVLILEAE